MSNPDLAYANLKHGYFLPNFGSLSLNECNGLQYICVDEANLDTIADVVDFPELPQSVQFNTYCSFTPGGDYTTIAGTATVDANSNGCDALDALFPNIKFKIVHGTDVGATFTDAASTYTFFAQTGTYTVTPVFENPYFTASPANAIINFASVNNSTQTQNFCIAPNGMHKDIEIVLHGSQASPGSDTNYHLTFKNKGNQIQSGTINLAFEDNVLDFVSAVPMTSSQSLNNLNWDCSNLAPFESRTIDFTLNANGPTETPPLNIGDLLDFTATINNNVGDETPLDNVFALHQTVVGSFDPNDKTCLEGNTIAPEKVGDYLHYLIRFQNSGTAPAVNIVVKDMIDTSKFDVASLQLISSSHPQVTRIENIKVEFIFENINLPADEDDESGSHGFVAFKIKTKSNLVVGNTVSNTADIFFDYNFPIVTNTATTVISLLGIGQYEEQSVSIAPNPVKNLLHISANDTISSIQVFDIDGRLIETSLENGTDVTIDISAKANGVYFVKVFTEKGMKVEKIIKQ
jgi:uncharacterized repeat protein (TIGR01451 family)